MFNEINKNQISRIDILKISLLSFVLVGISLWLGGNIGLDLTDEGIQWYDVWRIKLGEIPVLNFESYDPGRYYWSAFWSFVLGDGIIGLRISTGIFAAIGLTLGLLAAKRVINSFWQIVIVGCLLVMWMYPRHKLFDISLSLAAVFFAVRLLENPSLLRHFSSGVFVGVAAFFGRNHGFYGFLAFIFLILYAGVSVRENRIIKRIGLFVAGVVIGYFPMFILMFAVHGFFDALLDSIILLKERGGTNLYLPVPWPWVADYSRLSFIQIVQKFSVGFWFLLMPLFYIYATITILFVKIKNVNSKNLLLASTSVGVLYMHHVFSRAEIAHLAQGIHPLLLGLVSLPYAMGFNYKKVALIGLIAVVFCLTIFSVGFVIPFTVKLNSPSNYVKYNIEGDSIWIRKEQADLINNAKRIVQEKVRQNDRVLIVPHVPMMYRILRKENPVWLLSFLFPDTERRQQEMIRGLGAKKVNYALIGDETVDGRDDLRFRNTHGTLYKHLMTEFEPIAVTGLPANYVFLHRKGH